MLGAYPDMGGGGLYTRHNAVASYLSLTGLEGIVSSQRFILCAKRLGQSWKMKVSGQDDYDMILMVVDPYSILTASSAKELRDVGWQIVHVEPLYGKPSAFSYLSQNRYTHTAQFTKLRLWTFEGYRHIIYLDADMLIVRDLVLKLSGSMNLMTNSSLGMAQARGSMMNAGLLVITPSKVVFELMINNVMSMTYDTFYQEQAFLNVYWESNIIIALPWELNERRN